MRCPSPVFIRVPRPRQVPLRTEVTRAPLGARLEAAAGQYHGGGRHIDDPPVDVRRHTVYAVTVGEEMQRRRAEVRISMPALAARVCSASTSPGPPPEASIVSPPQNRMMSPTLNAWRP